MARGRTRRQVLDEREGAGREEATVVVVVGVEQLRQCTTPEILTEAIVVFNFKLDWFCILFGSLIPISTLLR